LITSNGIRNEGILEEVKVEPVDQKLKIQINLATTCNENEQQYAKGIAEL
jgi:hypothetical protein